MFLLFFVVSLVGGLDLPERMQRANRICSSYGHKVVDAKFGNESHLLCLKTQTIGSLPLMSQQSILLLDPGADQRNANQFPLADIAMSHGFPVEDPAAGSAEGYIGEDHHFYGVLHLGNRTLHADPYGKDDPNKLFGMLVDDNMAAPKRPRRDHAQMGAGFENAPYFPYRIEERPPKTGIARARICDLLLLADKEFFDKDANSSLNHVVQRMMHAVAQADIIFRNADFNEDGIPDNIGFSVKYILILTSNETNNRVFGDLVRDHSIDGQNYLMRFARLRRLSEVCLGVAFSGHSFHNRTLGLRSDVIILVPVLARTEGGSKIHENRGRNLWMAPYRDDSFTSLGGGMGGAAGGLCDRRAYGRSFNTLALAHATSDVNERVPERLAALTLAHEMGHSFGAHHDDNFPNPDCRGYLMGSQSTPTNNFEFSMCSKRLISATLSSMSYCLSEIDRSYCGNGIVEQGEACDCGLPSHCSQRDPCCTPRAGGALALDEGALHKDGCSVAPTAMCHPSQGLCCNADCDYANLSLSGIDCRLQEQECTCVNITSDCKCGLNGRCLKDGSCHAADCALLGLRECSCPNTGPGGKLSELKMCGACCQYKGSGEEGCLGVEYAARELMAVSKLPKDWPDSDYKGPNITLNICNDNWCRDVQVSAWAPGDVCVSLNVVGVCSPQGHCNMLMVEPSANIYPEFKRIDKVRLTSSSSQQFKEKYIFLNLQFVIYLFYVLRFFYVNVSNKFDH